MNRKLKDEDMDILFRGILKLKTVEECYDFFEEMCIRDRVVADRRAGQNVVIVPAVAVREKVNAERIL